MGVYLCNEGPYPEVTDILSTDGRNVSYHPYYDCGVCITAKVNCTIDKIGFLGGYISGSLWIAQGTTNTSYDANTKVEYSITSYTMEFTLPTPYEMQANTDYVIIVNGSGPRYNYETPFPKDCENIIYKHAVFAGSSATDRKFFITSITTTQTGTYLEEKPLKNAYIGEYVPPIDTPGIYHNATLGLISMSSDGSNWITITDKNLGATTVWNSGDALSEANCGKYYQWGNNYGFPFTGGITTSSTRIDASNYGPGNYYSSSTFITSFSGAWDTTNNGNLWGGETGTNEAMQGPCDTGFHVPLTTEWQVVCDIWTALGGGSTDGTNFGITLKLPLAGMRSSSSADIAQQSTYGRYWSSSRYNANNAYYLYLMSAALTPRIYTDTATGFPVRPFKNDPRPPYEGEGGWTKLY